MMMPFRQGFNLLSFPMKKAACPTILSTSTLLGGPSPTGTRTIFGLIMRVTIFNDIFYRSPNLKRARMAVLFRLVSAQFCTVCIDNMTILPLVTTE